MATKFTNFAGDTVGAQPTGFTETGASALAGWTVESVAAALHGKALRASYTSDGGGGSMAGLVWTAAPVSDVDGSEVVAKLRYVSGPSVTWFGPAVDVIVRTRGDADTAKDGVRGEHHHNDGKVYAQGYNAATANFVFAPGTAWFWIRVRRVGRYAWVRAWLDTDPEPTSWDITSLDLGIADAATHLSGQPALFVDGFGGSVVVEIDQVGWATDGDTAPREYILVPGRMRGLTSIKRDVLGSPRYGVFPRFICRDGAGDDIDYSAFLAAGGVSWVESVDQKVLSATVKLARVASGESLAPLVEASARNTDGASGYAPALYPSRYCAYWEAITADGATPEEWEYELIWEGRVDEVDWSGREAITLTCRDLGGWLAETQIEEQRTYAVPANPVATLLQSLLDDNPAHPTDPVPTLVVDGDPDWFLDTFTQAQTRLLPALLQVVDQFGWDLRFGYLSADDPFVLLLSEPRRDVVDPDTIWGPTEYTQVPLARVNDENVRNRLRIVRRDENGVLQSRSYADTASEAIFGNRWLQMGGEAIAAITSEAESDRLGPLTLSDLSTPEFSQAYRFRPNPYVMIGDFFGFSSNDVHYDVDQTGAVVQVQHERSNGGGSSTIFCNGRPRSGYRRWLKKSDGRYAPEVLSYTLSHSPTGTGALGSIVVSEATDELRVWARNGDTVLVGGKPDNQYLVAVRKPEALAVGITWPVTDGDWQIAMQAYAGQDRFTRTEATLSVTGVGGGTGGGGSGGPGTAPEEAPPTPEITAVAAHSARLLLIHSDGVDTFDVEWTKDGLVDSTINYPAGTASITKPFAAGQEIKARARYTNGGGPGPWSDFTPFVTML